MDAQALRGVTDCFEGLDDPRVVGRCSHKLIDIVMIALVGMLGPCDDWESIQLCGESNEDWFRTFLELPHGVPSHDTFARVFARLDPAQVNACFERWVTHLHRSLHPGDPQAQRQCIAIDGKALRGSNKARGAGDQTPLHLVSAWAHETKLVLGQARCDEKSNEITAIPELIGSMELTGCTVTIDAMGCQKPIAKQLHEKQADYALALKANHETLHTQAVLLLSESDDEDAAIKHDTHRTVDRGHGREETRVYTTVTLGRHTTHRIDDATREVWPGLSALGRVVSTRTVKGKTTTQTRYYLLSDPDVKHFAKAVRGHWGIENQLHWVLDVTMGEDASRTSKDHGPENLAIFRRLALNLFRANRDRTKRSLKMQRMMIAWNIRAVEELLNGVF